MTKTDKANSKQKEMLDNLEILIIDDNEQITKMLTTFLELKDHKCTVANDGKEGLNIIKENRHNVILLDLAMPEFDGYEILDTLQKEDPSQISKIIILTASSVSIETVRKFKELGVSSCLQKPVDIDQLLSRITSVID